MMLSIRKIVDSYFSKRTFPHWCVLLLDSAILFCPECSSTGASTVAPPFS